MKIKIILLVIVFIQNYLAAENPFSRGVNLTNWLQTFSARQIHSRKYCKEDLLNIKSLGCDVIRLPINLHHMTENNNSFTFDPVFLKTLDMIMDWAEDAGIYLILDNHTFSPSDSTALNVGDTLVPIWKNLADHCKNRSNFICYEILNEPHGISTSTWDSIQSKVVQEIRKIDTLHWIIVGGADYNSYHALSSITPFDDDKIIYTYHFYAPFLFTHQGATWTGIPLEYLSNLPFPYDPERMPQCPQQLKGTWGESAFYDYANKGNVAYLEEQLQSVSDFMQERDVPVFCGEFGVYIPNCLNEDRIYWYQETRRILEAINSIWTIWDYQGGFGLFEKGSQQLFDYDLNLPLLQSLGLNLPEQKEFVMVPDSNNILLFDDFIGSELTESSYGQGIIDFYCEDRPFAGDYCIKMQDCDIYNALGLTFSPNKDLSYLVENDFVLSLSVRSDTPGKKIDLRFVDQHIDSTDLPWRIRFTIDDTIVPADNQWHKIEIPLKNFEEQGAWDGSWHSPQGKFQWSRIDKFEIVSEHHDLIGTTFWFDEMMLKDQSSTALEQTFLPETNSVFKISTYPNPFSKGITFEYEIQSNSIKKPFKIKIFNIRGQLIREFVLSPEAGQNKLYWDGTSHQGKKCPGGIYICNFSQRDSNQSKKIMLIH